MTIKKPYFMENSDWYYFDEEEFIYKIKESAPDKAKRSYEEYYEKINSALVYE